MKQADWETQITSENEQLEGQVASLRVELKTARLALRLAQEDAARLRQKAERGAGQDG